MSNLGEQDDFGPRDLRDETLHSDGIAYLILKTLKRDPARFETWCGEETHASAVRAIGPS